MSTRVVIFVDFAAWGASEPQQRRVCGPRGYVLRGAEARAAHAYATDGCALFPHERSAPSTPTPSDTTLPGMAAWLNAQRTGVHRP